MLKLGNMQELLEQEVTRKDFLRYLGLAFVSLVGISALIQNLQQSLAPTSNKPRSSGVGYGATPYGR